MLDTTARASSERRCTSAFFQIGVIHMGTTTKALRGLHNLPPDALLTAREAHEYLRCGASTVRHLIAAGTLPVVRVGAKLVRIRVGDLQDWLTACADSAGDPSAPRSPGEWRRSRQGGAQRRTEATAPPPAA
jgi:excisionase family DNA binding protein